jgi:hypothetical protein
VPWPGFALYTPFSPGITGSNSFGRGASRRPEPPR